MFWREQTSNQMFIDPNMWQPHFCGWEYIGLCLQYTAGLGKKTRFSYQQLIQMENCVMGFQVGNFHIHVLIIIKLFFLH